MSLKINLFIFFLIISIGYNYSIVDSSDFKSEMIVVASSGLNLRTAPSLSSKIIQKIDFCEIVRVGSFIKEELILDTVALNDKENLINQWYEVEYKDKKGFLFGAYLVEWNEFTKSRFSKQNDFALLFPGCACVPNLCMNKEMTWYGIYKTEFGYKSKVVFPSYYRTTGISITGYSLCSQSGVEEDIIFMIGSENSEISVSEGMHDVSSNLYFNNSQITDDISLNKNMYKENDGLVYCYDNMDVVLSLNDDSEPSSVIWRGDLNGDNIEDFIIQFHGKFARLILYLSQKNNLEVPFVKVAEYNASICC